MAYDSRATLVARLTSIRSALDKARTAISYGTSGGNTLSRPSLQALLAEEQYVLKQIEQIDAGTSGGIWNRVRFEEVS